VILNQQDKHIVNVSRLSKYLGELRRTLGLGRRDCNVCLVTDREIRRLNALYRGKERATDVLSFPWDAPRRQTDLRTKRGRPRRRPARRSPDARRESEFKNHLGDIVISVETASRNARQEGHSTLNEIRWLILHGLLHLLGYDHESDRGEMVRLELALRARLGISGK
jgi:probable rRNA maturation factor